MAAAAAVPMLSDDFDCNNMMNMGVDKLTYEIFSILENKFLFGCDPHNLLPLPKTKPQLQLTADTSPCKVRILSIDAAGSTDGLLAAVSLAHLEATLRRKSGNPNARIAHFFDVVAGSGVGGVLAALLFTRAKDGGRPIFSADQALRFIIDNGGKFNFSNSKPGIFRRLFRTSKPGKSFKKVFGDLTLKDTLKAVLIPCYDLTTGAPVLFSRADALEVDGCDFTMADVCGATVTSHQPMELRSADGRKRITAIGGGIAMNNPTAAAITHVLNNKQEFPFCKGVEDLVVVSLGNGEMESSVGGLNLHSSPATYIRIAGDGAADMVDQAVSMAFDKASAENNYVRIQGNGIFGKRNCYDEDGKKMLGKAEAMLGEKNVESVLFKGKKLVERTNLEKLELFAGEVIKEEERRKTSVLPPVILKQASPSPRTSSATTLSTMSSC